MFGTRFFAVFALILSICLVSGCTRSGFVSHGAYPQTPANAGDWWGSYDESGDANTGAWQSEPFNLGQLLHIRVAGYPSYPGNRIVVRSLEDGEEALVPAPNPGEKWEDFVHTIPAPWVGRRVTLIAIDGRNDVRGWLAIQPMNGVVMATGSGAPFFLAGALALVVAALAWRKRELLVPRREPIAIGIACVLLTFHFVAITSFAVDIPIADEWECLWPHALAHQLNVSWLWALHNEHRILVTKLLTWFLYRAAGWNIAAQIATNFFIYIAMLYCFYRFARERLELDLGAVGFLAASTVAAENHVWGFQSQFHLFLLFFFMALWFACRGGKWAWAGTVAAVLSAFSFSIGVICAALVGMFYVYLGVAAKQRARVTAIIQAGIIFAGVALWFEGFHKNPAHPALVLPTDGAFWEHYLNVISAGFGYGDLDVIPGMIICLFLGIGLAIRVATIRRVDEKQTAWIALVVMAVGLLAGLGSVSMARAAFGAAQAKSTRYAEISFMLLPIFWLLLIDLTKRMSARPRLIAIGITALALYAPFFNDFFWFRTYSGALYTSRLEARRCVQRYFQGTGDGTCPSAYPAKIGHFLDRARTLDVAFTRDLIAAPK